MDSLKKGFHKLREWMHGSGRNIVIILVLAIALAMIGNYFWAEKNGSWFAKAKPTPTFSPVVYTAEPSTGPIEGTTIK